MAAVISRGYTFGATEQVTNTKFHTLIDSATISNIDRSNFDLTTTSPVHIAGSSPSSPVNGHLWYDTSNAVLRMYDGTAFQPVARGYIYTNRSGSSVVAGDVVILDNGNAQSVTKTTTASSTRAFGVVLVGGADAASVIVLTEGYAPSVKVTGSTSIGNYLFTSTTSGSADPSATIAQGAFAVALTSGAATVAAQLGGGALIAGSINASSKFTAVDSITFTRSSQAATGTVNYSHALGVVPTHIEIFGGVTGLNNYNTIGTCYIVGGSTFKNGVVFLDESTGTHIALNTHSAGYASSYPTNSQLGAVSAATTTNFTISWTLTGTPSGPNTINFSAVLAG